MDRPVEILTCTSDVTEVVFSYASEEECPVVSGIKLSEYIEILDRLRILAVGKCAAPSEVEDILVILCPQIAYACN